MAPWVTMHFWPSGQAFPCCVVLPEGNNLKNDFMGNLNTSSVYDLWNSEPMKEIRRNMLEDKPSRACRRCYQQEKDADIRTLRVSLNEDFGDMFDRAQQTQQDGTHEDPRFFYWDVRFNNLCNFKCRMCGNMLSSSWEAESRKHKTWNKELSPWMASPLREQIARFQDTQVVEEFKEAVETKTIKEIYWCGGEPLMWDIHWTAMQRIIDLGFANQVCVRYNTNLSRTSFKGANLFDLLPQFQDWQICSSLDGTGEVGEYIRDGLNYDSWLDNFKQGMAIAKTPREMRLDYTITMPGLLELKNMFDLSRELDTEILTKVMFTFSNDEILSPLALPKDLLHTIIDEALAYMEPIATRKQRALIDVIKNLKKRETFTPTKRGKERQESIDKIRRQDITKILSRDERILEWWTSI